MVVWLVFTAVSSCNEVHIKEVILIRLCKLFAVYDLTSFQITSTDTTFEADSIRSSKIKGIHKQRQIQRGVVEIEFFGGTSFFLDKA